MGLTVRNDNTGGDFEQPPAGNHLAICYQVVDLGVHEQEWKGEKKHRHRVRLSWELCDELMSDGRPFSVSREYTLSLSEKATLRHDLESWRGRPFTDTELEGFDLFNVLGKPCMVNVVKKPKKDGSGTYAAVANIAAIPKGLPVPQRSNSLVKFSLEDSDCQQVFATLPDWLKKKVNFKKPEEEANYGPDLEVYDGEPNDSIPF